MKRKPAPPKQRNPVVRDLWTPKYRKQIHAAKRGPASYDRNRRPDRRDGDYLLGRPVLRRMGRIRAKVSVGFLRVHAPSR